MVTPMHNATHASRGRGVAGAFMRVLSAVALALTALAPATMSGMPQRAFADEQVRGPLAHLSAELDYGRANGGFSLFSLFAQSHDDPVETGHYMGVKYTFVDEAYADGYTSLDDLADNDQIGDALVGQYEGHVSVYDFGSDEWLAAFVDVTRENGGADEPLQVVFSKWDDTGSVYDFVQYDAEAGIAYIPKSFYYDEDGVEVARSIQCQLVLPYSFSDERDARVGVEVESGIDGVTAVSVGVVSASVVDPDITIPVVQPSDADKVTLSDITVTAEDTGEPLALVDGVTASYDATTGELTLVGAPIASTTYKVSLARGADSGISVMSVAADGSSMNAWPWGKIENWTSLGWYEGYATEFPSYVRYTSGPDLPDSDFPGGTYGGYFDAVAASGCAYACLGNSRGDYSTGSTNWLIERALDGTSMAELSGYLEQMYPDCSDDGFFIFDGPAAYNTGVTGLSDPAGIYDGPLLVGYCGHTTRGASYGSGSHTDWDTNNVHMRVLKVNEADGYVICSFVTPNKNNQTGVGVYKFRIEASGAIDLHKASSEPSKTDGNSNYALDARYGLYSDTGCTNLVGTFELDATGHSTMGNVRAGDYFVKEIAASRGYTLDTEAHPVTVIAGQTTRLDVTEVPLLGSIAITKTSSVPNISDGNACYTFTGIRYDVYADQACTRKAGVGTLVLDEHGRATVTGVPFGTYYLKEDAASVAGSGFFANDTVYRVDVRSATVASSPVQPIVDTPMDDPIHIFVSKRDALTGKPTGSGPEPLSGALFEVKYWDDRSSTDGAPTCTWTFETDERGKIYMDDASYKVGGDELYHDRYGNVTYPLGTYSVQEVRAPASYLLPEENEPYFFHVTDEFTSHSYQVGNDLNEEGFLIHEAPIRHDLSFVKVDEVTQQRMANVPFLLSRLDADGNAVESHVIVTDANGRFDSAANARTHRTNANDDALRRADDGTLSVDESKLDPSAGLWFGIGEDGKYTSPNDEFGALCDSPTKVFKVEEIRSSANEGRDLVTFTFASRGSSYSNIDLGTVTDHTPEAPEPPVLGTTATDMADGDHVVSREPDAKIRDLVSMSRLEPGKTYTITGTLYDKAAGRVLTDEFGNAYSGTTTFTAAGEVTSRYVDIAFDATLLSDGAEIVVFESLADEDGETVATHEDPDDVAQSVIVQAPRVATTATDAIDGDHVVVSDKSAKIVDEVHYDGLVKGQTYEITRTLVDKATGEVVTVDGTEVTSKTTFVSQGSGTVEMSFEIDTTYLTQGTEFVVFETVTRDAHVVADHSDIDDASQTVAIVIPAIGTTATDAADGDHEIAPDVDTTIIDTVAYENLIVGRTYTVEGVLMDKATGEALEVDGVVVTGQATFVPETPSGEVTVEFSFDASGLAGAELVAFETLLDANGDVIAEHHDIDDEAQTVTVAYPDEPQGATPYAKTGAGPSPLLALPLVLLGAGLAALGLSRKPEDNIESA